MTDISRLAAALADRYRIERELGAGGMATVYLAHDVRHDRKVALKVLRPELSAILGGERFLTEIRTTANLQHPHILSLFDSGTVAPGDGGTGFVYYVMPYVEGESLRDRLTREKQLPVDEAGRIAREVADALQYAHTQGVVHRDIKPENILLYGGHAMVADFGIALAASRSDGATRMTETGMSLGTPAYMAPEQAMGEREITPRADIYALGAVLYEMLSGEPPFAGPTAQAIVARMMTEQPRALTLQRHTIPPHIEAAVMTALEKLPADRFETAKAFADALTNTGFTLAATAAAVRTVTLSRHRTVASWAPWLLATLALVLALWALLRPQASAPTSRQRVTLWHRAPGRVLDPGHTRLQASQAAIAPDGSCIVFSEPTDSGFVLMRKNRDEAAATPIAGTEGGVAPFFSPDGRWIGYLTTDGKLKKVPLGGGGSVTLADVANSVSATAAWLDDGTIVYAGEVGIQRLAAAGDSSWSLGSDTAWAGHTILTVWGLPGSRAILYTDCRLGNCATQSDVRVLDLRSGEDRLLEPNAVGAWYVTSGHLLFTDRAGGLFAAGFDAGRLTTTTGRVPIIPGVEPGNVALSANGTILYATTLASRTAQAELMWVARDGTAAPLDTAWQADFAYPAISPDGRTLAVSVRGETTQLWLRRGDGVRERLTQQGTINWRPAWSADGRSIVYASNQAGAADDAHYDLYRVRIDHSGPPALLVRYALPIWEGEVSPDGQWVVFRTDDDHLVSLLHARRLAGDTAVVTLGEGGSNAAFDIALSPDGRWIAYTRQVGSVHSEIYVAPFPDGTSPRQVSQDGGSEPRWARSGRELFYKSGGRLMSVTVTAGPALVLGARQALFPVTSYRAAANRQQYDVAPDGRHFVMIRDMSEGVEEVFYVEHWFPELLARMRQ